MRTGMALRPPRPWQVGGRSGMNGLTAPSTVQESAPRTATKGAICMTGGGALHVFHLPGPLVYSWGSQATSSSLPFQKGTGGQSGDCRRGAWRAKKDVETAEEGGAGEAMNVEPAEKGTYRQTSDGGWRAEWGPTRFKEDINVHVQSPLYKI